MLINVARAVLNEGMAILWVEHLGLHKVEVS